MLVIISANAAKSLTPGRKPMISRTWREMAHIAALDAADHGIGFAAADRERGNHGRIGAHDRACRIGGDAVTAGQIDVGLDVGAITRIVLGIDQIEILAGP